MPNVFNVRLKVEERQSQRVKFRIDWTTKFTAQEYRSKQAFRYHIYLENVDGIGDLDVRRRKVIYAWNIASEDPINRSAVTKWIDRDWLNEDSPLWGIGDTTDEWRAEVICEPHPFGSDSAKSKVLREEFA